MADGGCQKRWYDNEAGYAVRYGAASSQLSVPLLVSGEVRGKAPWRNAR